MRFSRRQFLKAACLLGTTAVTGCSEPARKLIPYIVPPEDIVPGEATWYATTCRECPAGCGMLAKNRDGHVIKVEGNPLSPVNTGRLCPRGQASVQGIYNPDRIKGPLRRGDDGKPQTLTWEEAEKLFLDKLARAQANRQGRIVFLTDTVTGSQKELIGRWLSALGGGDHIMYEPLAYEALREANKLVFGFDTIPLYHMDRADFLISFGADFLEAWISNVRFARQFASFHRLRKDGRNLFVYVGPRLSMTAANADHWIAVPPEGVRLVALGLLQAVLEGRETSQGRQDVLRSALSPFTSDAVEAATGVKAGLIRTIAERWLKAKAPLALAEGLGFLDSNPYESAVAANILTGLSPSAGRVIDFSDPSSVSSVARARQMRELVEAMAEGQISLMLLDRANPLFTLPPTWGFDRALQKVPFVVSFSSFPDETNRFAHLMLPTHTFLESWGDYTPHKSMRCTMQPVMGPIFDTRSLGDILLATGRKIAGERVFPEEDFYEAVRTSPRGATRTGPSEAEWQTILRKGGTWGTSERPRPLKPALGPITFTPLSPPPQARTGETFSFVVYPTIQFFDGRMANRPFLQEMPDPVTMVTWGGWVEIHPETARSLGIKKGDILTLSSRYGMITAPAMPFSGIPEATLAMPLGHGHAHFGRYASHEAGNPVYMVRPDLNDQGGFAWTVNGVSLAKGKGSIPVAHTDGSWYQHGRNIVRHVSWQEYTASAAEPPDIVLPIPEGFRKERDFYAPHTHDQYRWVMVVDLDRCIGCQACVVACYAENNVGIVGRTNVLKGREMSWIHIERYFSTRQPMVRFLPMLCQHCDEAPCESVCPVFAPHHGKEGLNNQVYNRCIGTRYCNQNCPYKVRRFNWFTFSHEKPLNRQLNPDVTVRQKGVMEKCSFCIQRIVAAKIRARNEGRKLRDGEFTTACAQTCPADVITFGNLLDPASRVSKLVKEARSYQVLGHLNTKPAVIYLKKIITAL